MTRSTDYGAPTARSDKMYRPLLTATHALHFISSIIVMSIAAYFIAQFGHNAHLRFWVGVVSPCSLSNALQHH
jgi:hypothetical protein